MAWLRKAELSINGLNLLTDENQKDGLDMEFDIVRNIDFTKSTANFKVYNASAFVRKEILKEASSIVFKAGYADETDAFGEIFSGFVWTSYSYLEDNNWVTEIEAMDQLDSGIYNKTFRKGTAILDIITYVNGILGYSDKIVGSQYLNGITMKQGFNNPGYLRGYLKACSDVLLSKGLYLFVDLGSIFIVDKGNIGDLMRLTIPLDYNSGLKSIEDITQNKFFKTIKPRKTPLKIPIDESPKIRFNCLLDPRLVPAGGIKINIGNPSFDWTYMIEELKFHGDNFGGDFDCTGEATL